MTIIAAFLGLGALAWGVSLFRYGGLTAGCLVTLATGICLGSEFFSVSLLTLDRALLGALLLAYVVARKAGHIEPKSLGRAEACGLLFLGVLILSTLRHEWRWEGMLPASRLIFYYLAPACLYWVARELSATPRGIRIIFWAFAGFGIYLGLTALAEVSSFYGLVFPRYIGDQERIEFLGRARGPLMNPSGNGIMLCACFFSWWMLIPYARPRVGIALLVASGVVGLGILATLTRCAWLGGALGGLIVTLAVLPRRMWFRFLAGGAVAGVVLLAVSWSTLSGFKRDKHVSVADMKKSAQLRPVLAQVALKIFRDHPVDGLGFGHYKHYDKYYYQGYHPLVLETVRPYHQHNVVLSLLTETGLVGTIPYLMLLSCWVAYAVRLWGLHSAPLEHRQVGLLFLTVFAAYFANGMFQDVTIVPMVHHLLFFLSGLTVGTYRQHVDERSWVPASLRTLRWSGGPASVSTT